MPTKAQELRQDHRGDRRQCPLCSPPDPAKAVTAEQVWGLEPGQPREGPSAMMADLVLVEVDCPQCGNANRAARRACGRGHGMCGGTGKVTKWLPMAGPTP